MSEHAYPRTPSGEIDVKELPDRVAMQSTLPEAPPFEARTELFRLNFRFLKANDLKMTTPVERDRVAARMRFYIPREEQDKEFTITPGVDVVHLPGGTVVSMGLRGGYSKERFDEGERKLRDWLAQHPEWVASGEPYGVYWNGPIVPAPLRNMEVHIPIRRAV